MLGNLYSGRTSLQYSIVSEAFRKTMHKNHICFVRPSTASINHNMFCLRRYNDPHNVFSFLSIYNVLGCPDHMAFGSRQI